MILAVIPARGGSKRLPGKNIATFGGRPLLVWSIALAHALGPDVRCVVSTEDAAIASVARTAGAEIVDRPPKLAGDESSSVDVLIHAVQSLGDAQYDLDGVLLLQPTNPLRPVEMVRRAITRFCAEPCDSLMAVSRRQLKLGRVIDGLFMPDYVPSTQSRHMPAVFYENGLFYLTKATTLMERGRLTGDRVLAFETERPFDEVDIDEPIDLVIGEAILAAVRDKLAY